MSSPSEYGFQQINFGDEDLGEPIPFVPIEDVAPPKIMRLDGTVLTPYAPALRCVPRVRFARPRERRSHRRQRHIARSTSSSDPPGGDSDLDDPDGDGPGLTHVSRILERYLGDRQEWAA
jgi:hypothetical protein